jgi:hypothetical protein
MNRWRVGEDRGSKEKDRCPLTKNGMSMTFDVDDFNVYKMKIEWQ